MNTSIFVSAILIAESIGGSLQDRYPGSANGIFAGLFIAFMFLDLMSLLRKGD